MGARGNRTALSRPRLDHTAGELDSPAFSRISYFHQVPVIDDDGFVVAESAARRRSAIAMVVLAGQR
jgi:hypothetical protein